MRPPIGVRLTVPEVGLAASECGAGRGRGCDEGRQREGRGKMKGTGGRIATSVCQLRHDQMEQGPTKPHTLDAARSY